jgi:hypothetical protein
MKKLQIIEVVLEHLRGDFERRQAAAKRTREQGNDGESKSEGKYDTRSTEENYLADGLARQALEAAAAAEALACNTCGSADALAAAAPVEASASDLPVKLTVAAAAAAPTVSKVLSASNEW